MAKHKSGEWRLLVEDALSELNPETLPQKIALAETAVWQRIEEVRAKPGAVAEREALDDAVRSLRDLKKRHFPGWDRIRD